MILFQMAELAESLYLFYRSVALGRIEFLQQPNTQPVSRPRRASLGFAFSLAGAILILLRGIVRIVVGDVLTFAGSDEIRRRFLAALALNIVGGIAVVFAILIIIGACLIYAGMTPAGGTIVIVFAVLSILVGSGWLIGLPLALVGGILGLLRR
jgi:hypothetical protein